MFEMNEEDYQTAGASTRKNNSFVDVLTIVRCQIFSSNSSSSKGVSIALKDSEDNVYYTETIWYKKKDGSLLDFNVRKLKHLGYLLGLNLDETFKNAVNENGNVLVKGLNDKRIGVICQAKEEEYDSSEGVKIGVKFSIVDFIDAQTKQTCAEKRDQKQASEADKILSSLKPLIKLEPKSGYNQASEQSQGFAPEDDTLPF